MERESKADFSSKVTHLEEARIRAVYAKRRDDNARYSCFNRAQLFMIQERERQTLISLHRHGVEQLAVKTILEIGCGTGYWLREFIKWGARPENITGVDLLVDRVAEARQLCPPSVTIRCESAADLAFPSATFDLVLQSTVFTSILDAGVKEKIASEMLRVVKRNGLIIWYDYHVNNPWNPDVRGVKKREIHRLFPDCWIELKRITLAPPLSRLIAPRSWLLAYLLERISLFCTHYIGVIRKR